MKTTKLSLKKFTELYDKQGSGLSITKYGEHGIAYCHLDRHGFACTRFLKYKTLKKWFESR